MNIKVMKGFFIVADETKPFHEAVRIPEGVTFDLIITVLSVFV